MRKFLPTLTLAFITIAILHTACGPREKTLTIFAATSLTDAQEELARAFEEKNPGISVKINFASSSNLALQIREGAKADIFMSANAFQMEKVAQNGLLQGEAQDFASNRVVFIVPTDNPASIASLDDLTVANLRLVLALPGTPIRAYTDFLLAAAAAERDAGYFSAVEANIRSEEANVRLVLTKVVLGEADAAFVYQSDVTADVVDEVAIIPVPERYQSEIAYPLATLATTTEAKLADSFIEFVLSPAGQNILARWGFVPIAESAG